jgi:transposase
LREQKNHLKETPVKKYIVELSAPQREELTHMILTGKAAARELTHTRILLKADAGAHGPGWSDTQIAEALEISPGTVARVRKRCATTSVQEAILPAPTSRMRRRRLDGTQEAYLIALVCSAPPDGAVRWTLRLLASTLVELGYVETVSHETVRQVLLANELKPWIKHQWCIPCNGYLEYPFKKRRTWLPRSCFSTGPELDGGTMGTCSSRWMIRGGLHTTSNTGACLQHTPQEERDAGR